MSAVKIAGIAVKTATIKELAHERLVCSIGNSLFSSNTKLAIHFANENAHHEKVDKHSLKGT